MTCLMAQRLVCTGICLVCAQCLLVVSVTLETQGRAGGALVLQSPSKNLRVPGCWLEVQLRCPDGLQLGG